jgi:putative tryptophan/tyrosine transport system substrate-binding protein
MRIGQTTLVIAFVLGLFAWSPSAHAQQSTKVPLIGILSDETPTLAAKSFEPFAQGLRDLGWVEGQNVTIERRYAAGNNEALSSLAAELVRINPDVILAVGTPAAQAAKTATHTIPIVFTRTADPVGLGLVPSLARPGGNLTGLSLQNFDIDAKRLEVLVTAVPDAKRVGVLWDPSFRPVGLKEVEGAARSLNLELVPVEVRGPDDFERAVRAMLEKGANALYVLGTGIFLEHSQQLVDLTVKVRVPAMFYRREFVEAGGLMSYAASVHDMYRRAAAYVDKILKGAHPEDIPVEQPTKFELVINLNTAKSLGLTIPPLLLARADEVIE